MTTQEEKIKITEFVLDDEKKYIISCEDSAAWTLNISRISGLITHGKGAILPESVDKFESTYDGQSSKIYLQITDEDGVDEIYIGETDDYIKAMFCVKTLNEFYARLKAKKRVIAA